MSSLLTDKTPVRILMYHLCRKGSSDPLKDFKEQLEFIQGGGYEVVHLNDIKDYVKGTGSSYNDHYARKIVLTFDDAYEEFYKDVYPLLSEYGLKATVCVPTGYIAKHKENRQRACWENGPNAPLMIWEELMTLSQDPLIEIIPHSVWHVPFDQIDSDRDKILYEVCYSKQTLEYQLNLRNIEFFCFPGGAGVKFKEKVTDPEPLINAVLVETGYVGALKAEYGYQQEGKRWHQYCIPRCEPNSIQRLKELLEGHFECR